MNKKLLIIIIVALLLFTACGSDLEDSSESVESQINKKDFITIANHQNECNVVNKQQLANFLEATLAVPKTINTSTLISMDKQGNQFCENYNRTWDDITCAAIDFEKATEKSCIIGFDFTK